MDRVRACWEGVFGDGCFTEFEGLQRGDRNCAGDLPASPIFFFSLPHSPSPATAIPSSLPPSPTTSSALILDAFDFRPGSRDLCPPDSAACAGQGLEMAGARRPAIAPEARLHPQTMLRRM